MVIVFTLITIMMMGQMNAHKDGVQHCNDKVRELILDSCKNLNAAYKLRRESRQTHSVIVKRENEIENNNDLVEFLENESEYFIMILNKSFSGFNVLFHYIFSFSKIQV